MGKYNNQVDARIKEDTDIIAKETGRRFNSYEYDLYALGFKQGVIFIQEKMVKKLKEENKILKKGSK